MGVDDCRSGRPGLRGLTCYIARMWSETALSLTPLDRFRRALLYGVAVSPSLGTAVSALGRLALYLAALFWLVAALARHRSLLQAGTAERRLHALVLLAVGYMALTALWSDAALSQALGSWTRHARLLTIPVLACLIASRAEARAVLRVFAWGQVFIMLSAWMLVAGWPVPWATGEGQYYFAVYGTYLEQTISLAVLAAILWFQRATVFGPRGSWLALLLAGATLVLTLGFMPGRSGHMVLFGVLGLAVLQALPARRRWLALLLPPLAVALLWPVAPAFRDRMQAALNEVRLFGQAGTETSSAGVRLVFWRASLQAVAERPLLGHGAGSWNTEYRRLKGPQASGREDTVSDPHQMFLLWAVEGGLLGLLLLCAVLTALWRWGSAAAPADAQTLQALVLALVISGLLNSMIYGIGMGDFFCVGLGLLVALCRPVSGPALAQQGQGGVGKGLGLRPDQ